MHLLFAANNSYVPHVATTLCSIFENNKEMNFDVHILATDITDENSSKLHAFVENYGYTLDVKIINPDELDINLSVCGKWGVYPSLKLYAADLFPCINKILYVDADMICLGSLENIYNINMDNYYVAMSTDEEYSLKHKERLEMPKDSFYGCAGLVWFNLDNWRRYNIREKCLSYFNDPANKDIIKFGEQDVINKVCLGHIYELPIEFNMFSYYWLHHGHNVPKQYKKSIDELRKRPVIIHYIDSVKPWFKDCRFSLAKYYWQYHSLTPWKSETYGYSRCYQGKYASIKENIKQLFHIVGIKKYDYCYDC